MKIIILGSGIAGLSAAIALRRSSHEVLVPIHLAPNGTRVLLTWGFSPLRAQLVTAHRSIYADGKTLQVNHEEVWDGVEGVYGARFYLAHQVDLWGELELLAREAGVRCFWGLGERGRGGERLIVEQDPENGVVMLADGTERKGDLIVAADGIHSRAVKYVVGFDNPARKTGTACFRCLIPSEEILGDEETRELMEGHEGLFRYLPDGEGRVLVWYPCRGNKVQNIAHIVPEHEGLGAREGEKAKDIKLWTLLSRDPLPTWHKSRLVLIGDAAHPMLPMQGQAGSQAIEDGAALGIMFSNFDATDEKSISDRLKMFANVRMNKASAMQKLSDMTLGDPEDLEKATQPYMPGETVPVTVAEQIRYRFSQNVFKDCEKELEKVKEQNSG
ncbi:FAD/NAD(P)-binding domain-containing protein [Mollisia scopiformis]|uniref:FAD/NAD(P)-binding domain-containing protein n=1 Tax=Mollisia scopiformis TaxID=149040 RepID=A0A194XMZ6_MOLSC|nr:FAD/NAD(P)-binding domain-containing protein [Mollisia scopiformis]KUJ21459.1 FAD/NAD(P)-binding domain-containing protein [Mollisia scopiformis]